MHWGHWKHWSDCSKRPEFLYFIIFHNSPACAVARRGSWVVSSIAPSLPLFENDAIDIAVRCNQLVLSFSLALRLILSPALILSLIPSLSLILDLIPGPALRLSLVLSLMSSLPCRLILGLIVSLNCGFESEGEILSLGLILNLNTRLGSVTCMDPGNLGF